MNPSRDCLIKSIKSYYSNSKNNKKVKTPEEKLKIKNRSRFFETPKVLTNKGIKKENLPTPIYNPYSSSDYSSSVQSRSPSPNPILPPLKEKKLISSKKKNHNYNYMRIFYIILFIFLIFLVFFML